MAQYIVQSDQTIWDIALQLYGSIEGAFALFVCNPKLTMTTDLKRGDILEYYDGIKINSSVVESIKENKYLPANSERHVYFKRPDTPVRMIVKIPESTVETSFAVAGDGAMIIDWGDNSNLQTVELTSRLAKIYHAFDNNVDTRRMKIYGDFNLSELDATGFRGSFVPVAPIIVDSFTSVANVGDLNCLYLFEGMVSLDLRNTRIESLAPIYDYGITGNRLEEYNGLMHLNLLGAEFQDISVLDDYLEYLAGSKTHGTRRPCTVLLDTEPSERGMKAIETILGEPEWNQASFASSWVFNINGQIYTTE